MVRCSTAHSIAYRQVRRHFNYSEETMTGAITPNIIADAFRFQACISFSCGVVLERLSYAAVLRDALNQFLRSEEETPQRA